MTPTTTATIEAHSVQFRGGDPVRCLALVVLWSRGNAPRSGEVALLPAGDERTTYVLGRGGPAPDDEGPRVAFGEQRPESVERSAPIESPFLSKKQALVTVEGLEATVENRGKLPLLVAGRPVGEARIVPGDVFELKNQLVLLCVVREVPMPASHAAGVARFRFGGPDAFGIVGESPTAWALRGQIAFAAKRAAHVLLLGPSGSGKELVAGALHGLSPRADKRMVARNAATLPAGLVDAELFGNVKNYPNPGMPERPGVIGEAEGSTLFLDEIGELSTDLQSHLLRVLDDGGDYHRLGDATRRVADVRLVAATNRPRSELKHDLAARFALRIDVPGLAERPEDIPLLATHILRAAAEKDPDLGARFFEGWGSNGPSYPRVAPALVRALLAHTFTTHVRELRAVLWRALSTSTGDFIDATSAVLEDLGARTPAPLPLPPTPPEARPSRPETVTAEMIHASLLRHRGRREKVWRDLGLANRYVLKRLMKKFGIEAPHEDADETDD